MTKCNVISFPQCVASEDTFILNVNARIIIQFLECVKGAPAT